MISRSNCRPLKISCGEVFRHRWPLAPQSQLFKFAPEPDTSWCLAPLLTPAAKSVFWRARSLLKERSRFKEAERAFQEAIRLNPQDALASNSVAGLLQEPWGLEKLSSLSEKADTNLRTPIGWRDIFN
jgi:hypothetical protein